MGKTVYHRRRRVRRQLLVLIGIAVVALLLSVILLAVFLPKKPVDTPADPATDDPQPTPAVTVTMPLPQSFVDDNTLTVNITRLRKKLEAAGLVDFIITRKGLGYMV